MNDTAAAGASPRLLIAGNWKMNGLKAALGEALAVKETLPALPNAGGVDVMICPPATLVLVMSELLKGGGVSVGAQTCHIEASGAHTGEISAEMLADAGAMAVILGHSERRADHGESDRSVCQKVGAAHRAGLVAIVCVGETAGQRQSGQTLAVVERQLKGSLPDGVTAANTIIAYEPVWAIGTGLTPTVADVAEVHQMMRSQLVARHGDEGGGMRLLYGGSVKPQNAAELLAVVDVNGALVGGASLKAEEFLGIIAACPLASGR